VASVTLPASVRDVDARAFRSSDVSSVGIAEGNPFYASYDGVLYGADLTRLLLIPGGRQGAVRISSKAEEVDAAAFSHCAGVDSISVDAGSAHLSSWEGLLYDADGTTLLRVPAGATDITIREGCTTIAAGALEACAKLTTINAPASVTSISPDVFTSVPTVSLPAASVILSEGSEATEAERSSEGPLTLASALAGKPAAFVNADVALDGEPVIGSFTVDGLTFAVIGESAVELVGVSEEAGASPRRVVASSQGLSAPLALPDLAPLRHDRLCHNS